MTRGLYTITLSRVDGTMTSWRDTSRDSALMYARLYAARGYTAHVEHIDGHQLAHYAARQEAA